MNKSILDLFQSRTAKSVIFAVLTKSTNSQRTPFVDFGGTSLCRAEALLLQSFLKSSIAPGDKAMASITIRNLDDETKERLRVRAAHRRRSMEEEARSILREALAAESMLSRDLASTIQERFSALGGVELEIPAREPMREPPRPGS